MASRLSLVISSNAYNVDERGLAHWEGPNPKPNTANRGLFVGVCGKGYGCPHWEYDFRCACERFYIQCYHCHWHGRAFTIPHKPADCRSVMTSVMIVISSVLIFLGWLGLGYWKGKYDKLVIELNQLHTRLTYVESREELAQAKISRLQELLEQQVQRAIAPEAEELEAWITETEEELKKHDS